MKVIANEIIKIIKILDYINFKRKDTYRESTVKEIMKQLILYKK